MNKKISIIIGGTLFVSCLFANGIFNLQNQGNTVQKILATSVTKDNYFIIPDSSTRYLTTSDLQGLSLDELEIARNEIYARHGYIFVSDEWKDFFINEDWYTPTTSSVTLNSIEEYNVGMILEEESNR